MGQSTSTAAILGRREINQSDTSKTKSMALIYPMHVEDTGGYEGMIDGGGPDYISTLPEDCLACIFQSLGSGDRKRCSLVCRGWLRIEGQSRHRLSLNANSELFPIISSLFSRFDAVTKLALKCDRRSVSIGDEGLILISLKCRNLTRLKLRACRELTDGGMEGFAKNCKGLKKLSCGSCTFGAKGMKAVLDNCSALEELSVKRLRSITDGAAAEPIGPGVAASSLKTICLKELYNGHCFGPVIIGAKNLRTLKLIKCPGDWDKLLQVIADRVTSLVEIHLERLQVSDNGLVAISSCLDLEILHLVKTPECTNMGLVLLADRCRLLRKLHIDGWKANRIGDEGLIAVAKGCSNLQELVLIGVNPTKLSLEALADGCPNLVKVKLKKCKGVTPEGAEWLRTARESLAVNLDNGEPEHQDASASDGGAQENVVEFRPPIQVPSQVAAANIVSGSTGRLSSWKSRLGVASILRRWSSGNSSVRGS
ncbi:hypothetical protein I3760_15G050300 [Carya illinoinensis]|nr:hypothetical protein I3760_15G050300 [Carya illinoinensis]